MDLLTAGIWRIPLLGVAAYLVDSDDGPVLIDAGMPWQSGTIVRALWRHGIAPGELGAILITHCDFDHVGGLVRIAREMRAPVYVPADEVDVIRGDASVRPMIAGSRVMQLGNWVVESLMDRFLDTSSVEIAGTLSETELAPGGLTVIETPGHTVGHVCFLDEARSTLLGGDLVMIGQQGEIRPPFMLADEQLQRASLAKIQQFEFDVAGFGHGPPLTANAAIHLRVGIHSLQLMV